MRLSLHIFLFLVLLVLFFLTHIAFINILPFPLSSLNIALVILLWLGMVGRNKHLLFGFCLLLLTELYSSLPFGLVTLAGFAGLIATRSALKTLFTSFSWPAMLSGGAIGLLGYGLFLNGALLVLGWLGKSTVPSFDLKTGQSFLFFFFINLLGLLLVQLIGQFFVKLRSPTFVKHYEKE